MNSRTGLRIKIIYHPLSVMNIIWSMLMLTLSGLILVYNPYCKLLVGYANLRMPVGSELSILSGKKMGDHMWRLLGHAC